MPVRGGQRAAAYFRKARAKTGPSKVTVGFLDRQIAPLAMLLEYGDPETNLPERPAFRNGVDGMEQAVKRKVHEVIGKTGNMSVSGAARVGAVMQDQLKESYHNFHGAALSARQVKRKGHDDPLIGHEGPKLIERIQARVDGREVG